MDKAITGMGCLFYLLILLLNVAWISFVVWAIYTVVTWVVGQ